MCVRLGQRLPRNEIAHRGGHARPPSRQANRPVVLVRRSTTGAVPKSSQYTRLRGNLMIREPQGGGESHDSRSFVRTHWCNAEEADQGTYRRPCRQRCPTTYAMRMRMHSDIRIRATHVPNGKLGTIRETPCRGPPLYCPNPTAHIIALPSRSPELCASKRARVGIALRPSNRRRSLLGIECQKSQPRVRRL